ncbi:hypothetical protein ACK8HX_07810 [Oryzobacter sp. R7]|uniref:hypothetical protein n=1 Tax=Oryzobacter faecalis TaxID=3388656 RepID=UPI00398D5F6D
MTQVVSEDFRAFVDARWPELESVARVVVLDPTLARQVTSDALGGLSSRWHEAVEGGRPGEDARRALLGAALAAVRPAAARRLPRPGGRVGPARPSPVLVPVAASWAEDEALDPVVAAVQRSLLAADPLDRALVGARLLWEARSHEVAHLLDRPHGELGAREHALDVRLAAARAQAQREAGLPEEGGWAARERDVADAVASLLHGQGDPPDPTALVVQRTGAVRRRHVLLGGAAAALAAAGGAAAVVLRDDAPPPPAGTRQALPAPSDPAWSSTQSWPARGPLADDPGVRALVRLPGQPPARVLWAGDVADRRVVVAAKQGNVALDGTEVLLWTGRRGAPTSTLGVTGLAMPGTYGVADLVTLAIGDDPEPGAVPTTLLVVLGRPDLAAVGVSRRVRPDPDGEVVRVFDDLGLREGIGTTVLTGAVPGALRIRHRYEELQPASTHSVRTEVDDAGTPDTAWFAAGARRVVTELTGAGSASVTSDVVVDEVLPAPPFADSGPGSRVVVVHTRTDSGALLVSAAVLPAAGGEASFRPMLVRSASVIPADEPTAPLLTRVEDLRPGVGRYLVVAPGAARVQLIAASPSGYPVSKVVRTGGRSASVVELVNADDASALRLIARDAGGRVLFDEVPEDPPWLLGL